MLETLQHTQSWNQYFAPMHSLNFSIYSDETQNTLWRIQNGALDIVKPKVCMENLAISLKKTFQHMYSNLFDLQVVVLLVGTNNTKNMAEEVAEGIFEIVKNIREKLPDAYIVLPVRNN